MVKNLIALKKQKRVGYFLFFHSQNCLMKTKGSHITHNSQIHATTLRHDANIVKYLRLNVGVEIVRFD